MTRAISRYGVRVLPNTIETIDAVRRAGTFIEGPEILRFERAFAERLGGVRAVSTSYGRMAFHYILQALDLPAGSEIVVPALTFWVIPEIARILGFRPVFADVDPRTFNVTRESIERVLTPKTSAIVPTHLWGLPCDMDEILEMARRHKLAVVEDCAHALGATYRGRAVGTFGDAALFSLQTLKPLNTYGGGMAVARDPQLAARIRMLAEAEPAPTEAAVQKKLWHGRVMRLATRPDIFSWTLFPMLWASTWFRRNPDVYWWEAIRPLDPLPADYRERYSNVQAALGLEGLKHLDRWTSTTCGHAARMTQALSGTPGVRLPTVPPDRTHAFYQYCAYVPARDRTVRECVQRGIDIETLHVDVCSGLPLFGPSQAPMPGAEDTADVIQIPVYESLSDDAIARIAAVVRNAASHQQPLDGPARMAVDERH